MFRPKKWRVQQCESRENPTRPRRRLAVLVAVTNLCRCFCSCLSEANQNVSEERLGCVIRRFDAVDIGVMFTVDSTDKLTPRAALACMEFLIQWL